MTSTFANVDYNFNIKLEKLENIIHELLNYRLDVCDRKTVMSCKTSIVETSNNYLLRTIGIKKDYENKEHEQIWKLYVNLMQTNNFINKMNRVHDDIKVVLSKYEIENDEITENIRIFNSVSVNITNNTVNEIKCVCGDMYEVDEKTGEHKCNNCGIIMNNKCFTSYESNLIGKNSAQPQSRYEPSKHCHTWLSRIQASDTDHIPDKDMKKIAAYIKRQRPNYLDLEVMREYLKEIKMTKYNSQIPLLLKRISGKKIKKLTSMEKSKFNIYFDIAIGIYNKIKPDGKPNCLYHPYIIYKIWEQILPKGERKNELLSQIHLQSSETLVTNDLIWEQICDNISDFTYKPTQRR